MTRVELQWDEEANAAYLYFARIAPGQVKQTAVACNRDGEPIATLDFSSGGELLGVELLDAERQVPRCFREPRSTGG